MKVTENNNDFILLSIAAVTKIKRPDIAKKKV